MGDVVVLVAFMIGMVVEEDSLTGTYDVVHSPIFPEDTILMASEVSHYLYVSSPVQPFTFRLAVSLVVRYSNGTEHQTPDNISDSGTAIFHIRKGVNGKIVVRDQTVSENAVRYAKKKEVMMGVNLP